MPAPRDPHYGRGRDEEDCCKASERSGGIIQSTVHVCLSCIYDCIYLKLYLPSLNKTYFELIILICQLIHVLNFLFVFPYPYFIKLYFHYIAYKPRHEPINHILVLSLQETLQSQITIIQMQYGYYSNQGYIFWPFPPNFLSKLKNREEFEGGIEKKKGKLGKRRKKEERVI